MLGIKLRSTILLGACLVAAAHAADWQIGAIPDVPGGKFSTLRVDNYGNAHVAYVDAESVLRYSFWDRKLNKWFSTSLERGMGFCSLALDSKQRPHISRPGGTGVIHLYFDGEKWQRQFADVHAKVINYYTSIVLDSKDYPIISFYEEAGAQDQVGRLRLVAWNGQYWDLKTVDPDTGSGKFNFMAMNSHGEPEIAVGNVEYKNVSLRYDRRTGQTWNVEVLDDTKSTKWSVCLVLDKSDTPHIAYTESGKVVRYATRRNGKWEIQDVDAIKAVAYPDRNGIALDENGTPYISYYDAGAGLLKVAHQQGNRWVAEIVDQNFAGLNNSLQIYQGTLMLTYTDESSGAVKFARRTLERSAALPEAGKATARK
jgi:hypothetical protein